MVRGLFLVLVVLFVVLPLAGLALWALLSTLVVGLIIGALARAVIPGPQRISLLSTALAGLVGAIVGGFVGDRILFLGGLATLLLQIGVAAVVVALLSAPHRRFNRLH